MPDTITSKTEKHSHTHAPNRFAVIPTPEKLKADLRFKGQGIRIAFLDSGFYPHPDFADRVVAFHDVADEERSIHSITEPKGHHWHGTQTAVSCAGSGALSGGIYRGIASEAELVLVKVSKDERISDDSIEAGLRWIIANREKYQIRVLNMSLGGDKDAPTAESCINQLCEGLVDLGVTITVAAGNSSESCTIPPASAPSVVTVGGYSDENQFATDGFELYHSSFGKTRDGNIKPEIIAPAMYVAAPILPNTEDFTRAETLSMLWAAPDYSLDSLIKKFWQDAGLAADVLNLDTDNARRLIEYSLRQRKIIATHSQHVDGTSFAAPITASVVAQMIEANPRLSPAAVKSILVTTAERIESQRAIRQGYGVLNAKRAVELALSEKHFFNLGSFGAPRREGKFLVFRFHDDRATKVNLAGNFNGWNAENVSFARSANGTWEASIEVNGRETLRYKIVIDGHHWTEDPTHGRKEEDGFGGFHSVLDLRNI